MVQDVTEAHDAPSLTRIDANAAAFAQGAVRWARDSILFSSCNEDSGSELRAFGSLAEKRVLCITAGGGRVLNLLADRPESIWAIDLNPAQNHLLELKVAALRMLEHGECLGFLGVRERGDRLDQYARLRPLLTREAQHFFDSQPELIAAGILFEGRLERFLRKLAAILQYTHALGVRRVFECEDLEQQRAWLARLDSPLFRAVAETLCRRSVMQAFSGDPGFYRYVPREVALHRVIYGGVIEHFRHHLARDNPLMQLVFFGRIINEASLPVYLNAATYDRVRAALEHVRLVTFTGTIHEAFARAGQDAFDALSLSDISSYLDDAAHDRLFEEALAAASPGAMLCSRSNIHHRPLRLEHEARLVRDHALERELAISDHSCVHKFLVGRLIE